MPRCDKHYGGFCVLYYICPFMKRIPTLLLLLIAFVFVTKTTVTAFFPNLTIKVAAVSDVAETEESQEAEEDESGVDNSISSPEPIAPIIFHAREAAATVHVFRLLTTSFEILSPPPQA